MLFYSTSLSPGSDTVELMLPWGLLQIAHYTDEATSIQYGWPASECHKIWFLLFMCQGVDDVDMT